MPGHELNGLNVAYVAQLLEDYLDAPASVPREWRDVFERDGDVLLALPGLRRLAEPQAPRPGPMVARATPAPPAPPAPPSQGARPDRVDEPPRPGASPMPVVPAVAAEVVVEAAPSTPAPAPAVATAAPAQVVRAAPPTDERHVSEPDDELLGAIAAAARLVKAYRTHGHLAARLDPLGSEPIGDPALDETRFNPALTPELLERIPARLLNLSVEGETLKDALPRLRDVYTGTIAYEVEHISDYAERMWLRQAIESGRFRRPLPAEERRALLARLSQVEGFEQYLRRAFLGQKQFSLEGLDVLIVMIDEAVESVAASGAHQVVIGMAHRGRLNALAHAVGRSYESILREFEGERSYDALVVDPEGGTGDVKYHLPASGTRATRAGEIDVALIPNPSHLEAVDPVVEGRARAEQTDRSGGPGLHDPTVALPLLIHGDASFAGQGIVAETLNLQGLDGYTTGGTLHLIGNNQVGFTTDPFEGRSTRYCSDLAKGFDVPIIHVNADDPEAAISAVRLALAFREEFGDDVVIDLVGYRRFGHNEQDEASYTQPLQVARIESQPTVRQQYAEQLVQEGVLTEDEVEAMETSATESLREAHERLRAAIAEAPPVPPPAGEPAGGPPTGDAVITAVSGDRLRALNEELLRVPPGFAVNPKLARQLERRNDAMEQGGIDWGQAEALAFASLLEDGIPIRLTGQDTERGTFSHRHLVLHDHRTGGIFAPIQHLAGANASFEVFNSPLSEFAVLGFEYGYSVAAPDALVLWEAQFGDFANSAQVVIDQFITAGRSKWGQTSRLTLLLPHGYEGNGPEHSSARLERFLQLGAQDNIRIASPTTAAQYFHLLRRQALDATARPLVVMTPKGLLRLRHAASSFEELADDSFRMVLDDPSADRERVRRLVLCSGKVYYDLVGHDERAGAHAVAIARLEQLYPFPVDAVAALVASYPHLDDIVWAQEEPQNMGPWRSIRHRLDDAARSSFGVSASRYVGRPWRASPSEGYPTAHQREQDRIVRTALTGAD